MGLSSEEIFMVHLVASLSVMGYSKYKKNKVNINASDKETFEIITDGSNLENGKLNPLVKTERVGNRKSINGYEEIERFREKAGLKPYSIDSVANVTINNKTYFGVNSTITRESQKASKALR